MYDRPFNEIFRIMKASFPKNEMGTYARQEALLSNPYYRLITEEDDNNKIIAFLAAWEFPLFRFIEHIAVDPDIRGGGIGGKLVAAYIREAQKPVLLEVEPPITAMAQRRVSFYERLGFHFNLYDYLQPPLQEGQADLPLNIMSYPDLLTEAEFILFKKVLYAEVYKLTTIT